MKMGLLGAIGGLGQGMQTVGADIMKRRERALEEARRNAEYERRRADTQEDKAVDFERDVAKTGLVQDRQDQRYNAGLQNQQDIAATNRSFKAGETAQDRAFRASEAEKNRSSQKELARLNKSLEGENSAAAKRLSDTLSADDVKSVQYGVPDGNGYAEVIVVTNDGTVRKTGQKVYRPKKDDEDGDTAL